MLDTPITINSQMDMLSRYIICDKQTELKYLLNCNGYFNIYQYAKFALSKSNIIGHKPNTDLIIKLYNFDNLLRNVLFTYCKKTELRFKTALSNAVSSHVGSTFFYLDKNSYTPSQSERNKSKRLKNIHFFNEFFESITNEEKNIRTNIQKYPDFSEIRYLLKKSNTKLLPCWAVFPYYDFGTILNIYFYLNGNLRIETLKYCFSKNKYTKYHTKAFDTWLTAIRNLRNTCAHNGQIINKSSNIIMIESFEENLLENKSDLFSRLYAFKKILPENEGNKLFLDIQKIISKTGLDVCKLNILPDNWDIIYKQIKPL